MILADFLGIAQFLAQILCWIKQIGAMVLNALIDVINLAIVGLVAVVNAVVSVLPDVPEPPEWLGTIGADVIGAANWLIPIGFCIEWLAALAALWLAMQGVFVLLRWAKAVNG
jgi:hypothetical protein